MKTSPYLVFNGNCIEAIALYEKAFKTKANYDKCYAEFEDKFGLKWSIMIVEGRD